MCTIVLYPLSFALEVIYVYERSENIFFISSMLSFNASANNNEDVSSHEKKDPTQNMTKSPCKLYEQPYPSGTTAP